MTLSRAQYHCRDDFLLLVAFALIVDVLGAQARQDDADQSVEELGFERFEKRPGLFPEPAYPIISRKNASISGGTEVKRIDTPVLVPAIVASTTSDNDLP